MPPEVQSALKYLLKKITKVSEAPLSIRVKKQENIECCLNFFLSQWYTAIAAFHDRRHNIGRFTFNENLCKPYFLRPISFFGPQDFFFLMFLGGYSVSLKLGVVVGDAINESHSGKQSHS